MDGTRAWQRRALGKLGLMVVLAFGCGGDERISLGDFCSRIGTALCDRGVACGLATAAERPACLSEFQAGCCGADGSCGMRAENDAEEMAIDMIIQECTGALPTFDCAMLGAGTLPVECGGATAASALTYTPAAQPSVTLTKVPAAANFRSLTSRLGQLARTRRLTFTR
jgi:hypothetical protein